MNHSENSEARGHKSCDQRERGEHTRDEEIRTLGRRQSVSGRESHNVLHKRSRRDEEQYRTEAREGGELRGSGLFHDRSIMPDPGSWVEGR